MDNFLSEEKNDLKNIFQRIRKKDFSGEGGVVLKNSIYQILTNFTTKIGAFIFTVIMARLLLPELFGEYSLVLSTILIFTTFSDLGIGQSIIRFASKELGKKDVLKANAYIKYLAKIRIFLSFLISLILLILAKFIATDYYNKPIFLALSVGATYILFTSFVAILQSILQAHNSFKSIFFREILFQVIRIVAIPFLIFFLIKNSFNNELILFIIILSLSFTYLLSGIFFLFNKEIKFYKIFIEKKTLSKRDKKEVKKFLFLISATVLSGVFFGYIDIIILGRFVSSEYIAFYNVAFNFIGAILPLLSFSSALLPSFVKMNEERLNFFFKKIIKISICFSLLGFFVLLIFAPFLIRIVFGIEYLPSSTLLRFFSLLLIISSMTEIYSVYFTAKGKPQVITSSLIFSTAINIILNYILISSLIAYGQMYALYGATIATIISRLCYTFFLIFSRRNGLDKNSFNLLRGKHK